MKTAQLHIRVIEFTCPYCDENIAAPNGSHMFPLEEPLPDLLECDACDKVSQTPKRAFKLKAK